MAFNFIITYFPKKIPLIKSQRVKEQGIHPSLGKLIYLTEGEFEFFKRLKEEFLKRAAKFLRKPKEDKKESSERLVERRSLTIEKDVNPIKGFIYQREAIYWRWQRVKEYYREQTASERYERLAKAIKT